MGEGSALDHTHVLIPEGRTHGGDGYPGVLIITMDNLLHCHVGVATEASAPLVPTEVQM